MLKQALYNPTRTRKVHGIFALTLALTAVVGVTGCQPSRNRAVFESIPSSQHNLIIDANSEGGAPKIAGAKFSMNNPNAGGNYQKGIAKGAHFQILGGALNGR